MADINIDAFDNVIADTKKDIVVTFAVIVTKQSLLLTMQSVNRRLDLIY